MHSLIALTGIQAWRVDSSVKGKIWCDSLSFDSDCHRAADSSSRQQAPARLPAAAAVLLEHKPTQEDHVTHVLQVVSILDSAGK